MTPRTEYGLPYKKLNKSSAILWTPDITGGIDKYSISIKDYFCCEMLSNRIQIQKVHLKTRNRGSPILLLIEIMGNLLK